ncbi:MAG: hypothetical protein JWQ86_5372 [Mycobacterium sp.]|jgi:hypothetical protein|nr:hypothetical protein [Mycobacterium sp.]MDT5213333.1 hypothetical protein [Mycobacterium sp.]
MRTTRHLVPLLASAGAVTALLLAPLAAADPSDEVSNMPTCTTTGDGTTYTGTTTTECATPGNVQIAATAPEPDYPYPWDDEFYGSALIMGPNEGPHGGGGGGGGGHR